MEQSLETAKRILESDGIIGLPTETVYGLAALASSEKGLREIFAIKERPLFDPLIVHLYSKEQVGEVVDRWLPLAEFIAKKFWPGPLTMVLPKKKTLNSLITAGLDTVAVRVPAHPMARALLKYVGKPLAAPSANKFGKTSPTCFDHVKKVFPELYILDGGASSVGIESTVIQIHTPKGTDEEKNEKISVLRPGVITTNDVRKHLEDYQGSVRVEEAKNSVASPGHLAQHYQPIKPLVVLTNSQSPLPEILEKLNLSASAQGAELILNKDPQIAARFLYSQLHELSSTEVDFLYTHKEEFMNGDRWEAIWDRLRRAASIFF